MWTQTRILKMFVVAVLLLVSVATTQAITNTELISRHRRDGDSVAALPHQPQSNLDCYHEDTPKRHQLKCFTDQGIQVNFPTYRAEDGSKGTEEDQKQNYVNAIIAQNPEKICSHKKNFKAALKCAMNYTVACMPVDYRGYLPQPHKMAALVDKLCENPTRFRYNCVARKAENLFTCGYRKGQTAFRGINHRVTVEEFLCKAFQFNAECQLQELRPCGCATVRLYETISRDFLYPPNCPRPMLKSAPTECNAGNEALFVKGGVQILQAQWSITFVLSMASLALWWTSFCSSRRLRVQANL